MNWKLHELLKLEGDSGGSSGGGGTGGSGEGGRTGEGAAQSGSGEGGGAPGSGGGGSGEGGSGSSGQGGGTGNEDWRTQHLSDEYLAGAPALKDFDTVEDLAKNFVDLQAHVGQSIRIPGEDASAEAKKEFHQRLMEKVPGLIPTPNLDDQEGVQTIFRQLGAPEKPDDYRIPEVEGGENVDHSMTEAFRNVALKANLTQAQFDTVVREVTATNIRAAQESRDAQNEDLKTLSDEWGAAYDRNRTAALNVAKQTGAPKELIDAIQKGQASASTIKWLHSIHTQSGGEGLNFTKDSSQGEPVLTPAEAQIKIDEIMNNREHPYWKSGHPGQKEAQARVLQLHKLANPGASTDINDLRAGGASARR